jgi:hypothetical protein
MSLKSYLFVRQQYNMDGIDITDSAFALDVPNVDSILTAGGDGSTDYTMFMYIGFAILVLIGLFIYKFYQNKNSEQQEDCPGGFCTMDEQHSTPI